MNRLIFDWLQPGGKEVCCLSCLDEAGNVVLLVLERLMLKSEPCCLNFALIIEDDVQRVLLSANTVHLTTVALDLDIDELLHLIIKWEVFDRVGATIFRPHASLDEVLEWRHPRVDWALNRIV